MSKNQKSTFAVLFGNRTFFPASLQTQARTEVLDTLKKLGHKTLVMPVDATPHGAIETRAEGELFDNFLRKHHGQYQGIILSLPNFGDENGATAALRNANVPIFIQAYPDDLDKMAPALRRDAFCGKLAMTDVLRQSNIKFTTLKPHTVHPLSDTFVANVDYFDRLCRVVDTLTGLRVGALGARTSPFKSVRIDELALEQHGITIESFDMSHLIQRTRDMSASDKLAKAKEELLRKTWLWNKVPAEAVGNLAKFAAVMEQIVQEDQLDVLAIRCWIELQEQLGISPCVLNGLLSDQGIPVACEVDLGNAVIMAALQAAGDGPATILDWNNNYGDDANKCIIFHCGNVPPSMLQGKYEVVDHSILACAIGEGCSYGCLNGRIKPMDMTFGGLLTEAGKIKTYLGQGRITNDPIPDDFFGCAGVAEIENLPDVLDTIAQTGHRHHVSLASGKFAAPMREAFERYLGFEVTSV